MVRDEKDGSRHGKSTDILARRRSWTVMRTGNSLAASGQLIDRLVVRCVRRHRDPERYRSNLLVEAAVARGGREQLTDFDFNANCATMGEKLEDPPG